MKIFKDNFLRASRLHLKHCALLLLLLTAFFVMPQHSLAQESQLTGNIQIFKRQLVVNGAPFIMKGVCYSPVPKGCSQDQSLLIKPVLTEDDLTRITRDFQMMQVAGINTIRTYKPILNPQILTLLNQYQLRTIVPVADSYSDCISDPSLISTIVNRLKNEPSTLIWEIGNEWNYNLFYTTDTANPLTLSQCANFINTVIGQIRTLDTVHPISTDIGEIPDPNSSLWQCLASLDLDLFGTNIYPNGLTPKLDHPFTDPSTGNRFKNWCLLSTKPLYLGEFGANAFAGTTQNPGTSENDPQQAAILTSLLDQVFGNLSAENSHKALVGGCVFEWCDEWWKGSNPTPTVHYNNSPAILEATDPSRVLSENTDALNEQWWGIVSVDGIPRPAYNAVRNFYTTQ